jgi:hypothetical protein
MSAFPRGPKGELETDYGAILVFMFWGLNFIVCVVGYCAFYESSGTESWMDRGVWLISNNGYLEIFAKLTLLWRNAQRRK